MYEDLAMIMKFRVITQGLIVLKECTRKSILYTHIVLLYSRTTYNSLAEMCFISCITMFK